MNIFLLLDPPSMLFSINCLIIGFIVGGKNLHKSLSLARDISIPIGVCGTVLGCTMMLAAMDDPSAVGPALSVALLGVIYCLMLHIVLNVIVHKIKPN